MSGYYDVLGNPISDEAGRAIMANFDSRRVGHDTVITDAGPVEVSTMFIPSDLRTAEQIENGDPVLLFETATLLADEEIITERRATGPEAVLTHLDVLDRVQPGRLRTPSTQQRKARSWLLSPLQPPTPTSRTGRRTSPTRTSAPTTSATWPTPPPPSRPG